MIARASPGAGASRTRQRCFERRDGGGQRLSRRAATAQFTRDTTNSTVAYSGSPTDFTYRRMILHYANLCVVAGGVDLFLLGSELRGLETIRGPAWTKAGTTGGDGMVTWDYPFVAGLIQLADDVRASSTPPG